MGLPKQPTAAQKRAQEALSLTPEEQAARWQKTTSGRSERWREAAGRLEATLLHHFPTAERTTEYNMEGWKVRRPTETAEWKGTIDPNWIRIYLAERKQGLTVHYWDPYAPERLKHHGDRLQKAGFKVMVGCLQFNRRSELPVEALEPVLAATADAWRAEGT